MKSHIKEKALIVIDMIKKNEYIDGLNKTDFLNAWRFFTNNIINNFSTVIEYNEKSEYYGEQTYKEYQERKLQYTFSYILNKKVESLKIEKRYYPYQDFFKFLKRKKYISEKYTRQDFHDLKMWELESRFYGKYKELKKEIKNVKENANIEFQEYQKIIRQYEEQENDRKFYENFVQTYLHDYPFDVAFNVVKIFFENSDFLHTLDNDFGYDKKEFVPLMTAMIKYKLNN